MKIQYASDLHLEFRDNSRFLKEQPLQPSADVLVLAGDIGHLGAENYTQHPFWDWVSENYKACYVVPGNHEFYKGYDLSLIKDGFWQDIRPNVHSTYNQVVRLGDVDLILTTLWAKISVENAYITECSVPDFRYSLLNGKVITFSEFNHLHQTSRAFIEEAVAESTAKHLVVATHHLPTFELMAPEFKGSPINGAFTVEMGDFIASSRINYWIYGHSHRNIDKVVGSTRCVCNQLGYVHRGEHATFRGDAVIEI